MELFSLESESANKYSKDLTKYKAVQLNKFLAHQNGILKFQLLNVAVGWAGLFGGEH